MGALDTYTARVRRLLTDASAQYWSPTEITDDINQARERVAADTKCLRQIVTGIQLNQNQEQYSIAQTVSTGTPANLGGFVIEVLSVTIYWGNMRVICTNRSFTEQNAKLRIFQNYQTRPGSVAMVGNNVLYVNPIPDQNYVSDWDVVILPSPLQTSGDPEVLPVVFQPPVAFYAAHLAKFSEQSIEESSIFEKEYTKKLQAAAWAAFSSRFRDAYRR